VTIHSPTGRIQGDTADTLSVGRDAPNFVPAHTAAKYVIRAETIDQLAELRSKFNHCIEAGAIATGSGLS
jgi:metal-dependent amidase/aminoacylase/carboxypeptidase family protein